jgi:hypothetical protein
VRIPGGDGLLRALAHRARTRATRDGARLRGIAERLAQRERCPSLVETLVLDVNGSLRAYSANASDDFVLVRDGERSLRDAWEDDRWRANDWHANSSRSPRSSNSSTVVRR